MTNILKRYEDFTANVILMIIGFVVVISALFLASGEIQFIITFVGIYLMVSPVINAFTEQGVANDDLN